MVLSVLKIEQNMKNNVSSVICAGMFFCARDWRGGEAVPKDAQSANEGMER